MKKVIAIIAALLITATSYATVVQMAGNKYIGLSSDTKPASAVNGSTFYETDTRQEYLKTSGTFSLLNVVSSVTYSAILVMSQNATLLPGMKYTITDFRTYHLIPNTSSYQTGTVEPIIVTAVSTTALSPMAYSTVYPQDIIYYELVDSGSTEGDMGRIIFRHDTKKNIKVWEDWRNNKYRRWFDPATNAYTSVSPIGVDYIDQYMFENSSDPANSYNVSIAKQVYMTALSNNIWMSQIYDVSFEFACNYNTVLGVFDSNSAIGDFTGNVFLGSAHGTAFGMSFFNSVVGDGLSYCSFLYDTSVTIGTNFQYNNVGVRLDHTANPLVFGDNVTYNEIVPGLSTFPVTTDITGVSEINLTGMPYVGIINVTGTGSPTITSVVGLFEAYIDPEYEMMTHKVKIVPAPGFSPMLSFGGINVTLNGSNGDYAYLYWDNNLQDVLMELQPVQPLSGTTNIFGGSLLATIGTCTTGTASVIGAATTMTAIAQPSDGVHEAGIIVTAYVSASEVVTVDECALVAVTPAARSYYIRVVK